MVKWLFFRLAVFDRMNDESDEPADEGNDLPLCLAAFGAIEPRVLRKFRFLFLHVRFVL